MNGRNTKDGPRTDRLPEPESGPTRRLPGAGGPPSDDPGRTARLPAEKQVAQQDVFPNSPIDPPLDPGATKRLPVDAALPSFPIDLARSEEIIDGRYQVEQGPLGEKTGEAQVFKCLDLMTRETVALKLYKEDVEPKREVLENLLNLDHPNLVALRAYGRWAGRFYEVQEFCGGGSLEELSPLSESALIQYLPTIINGLNFCHRQGIIHRDVKPNNILFRDETHDQVVIGDFGISSYISDGDQQMTRTYMFFTIDYTSPEQLQYRRIGPPTDYYSLGMTLLHLIVGHSPFHGLAFHEIVAAHIKGVPIPEDLSDRFGSLIKGLLRKNPEKRWGFNQVRAWLQHEPVLTDQGLPDVEEVHFDQELPYPECPKAKTPRDLAGCLYDFNAADELFSGRIRLWANFFDPELAARIGQIEEKYREDPALGIQLLAITLNPTGPLKILKHTIQNMDQFKALVLSPQAARDRDIDRFFQQGLVEAWLEVNPDPGKKDLLSRLNDFNESSVQGDPLGIWPWRFLLSPTSPLPLTEEIEVKTPEEMALALWKSKEARKGVMDFLRRGVISAWLQIVFPERPDALSFVEGCRRQYRQDIEQGAMALGWYFKPSTPFFLGRHKVNAPRELAGLIDSDPELGELGERLLLDGTIRVWLTATGMLQDSDAFDEVVSNSRLGPKVKLEMVLRLLDPSLSRPTLEVTPKRLDLGEIPAGSQRIETLSVRNTGRGHLAGRLHVDGAGPEVILDPPRIEGSTIVEVRIELPHWLSPKVKRNAVIVVNSNGGGAEIPLVFQVVAPPPEPEPEPEPQGTLGRLFSGLLKKISG